MIVFTEGAISDLERIFEFNLEAGRELALRRIERIRRAILKLEEVPHAGRPVVPPEIRELVIGVGKTGYVALYHLELSEGLVRILAIRHQREAGYRRK